MLVMKNSTLILIISVSLGCVETAVTGNTSSNFEVGNYIASGLGLFRPVPQTSSTSTTLYDSSTVAEPSNYQYQNRSSAHANLVLMPSNLSNSDLGEVLPYKYVASSPASNFSPVTTDVPDSCWQQWTSFWSQNESTNAYKTIRSTGGTTVLTSSWTSLSVVPSPIISKTRETLSAFGWAYGSQEAPVPTAIDAGSTITFDIVSTITMAPGFSIITPHVILPTPSCVLPSYMEQCQSQWDAYDSTLLSLVNVTDPWAETIGTNLAQSISTPWTQTALSGPPNPINPLSARLPSCSQASIKYAVCQSLQSAYLTSWRGRDDPAGLGDSTITTISNTNSVPWPVSSLLGPGCSVGCAGCAITGGTIRLIYWPVTKTSTLETNLVTASAFGTIFTSPTVYISFASIYASDSCSQIGLSYGPTILPLEPTKLSSVWESYPNFMSAQTAWFNFTDLLGSTLPASIASRRPQCAVWLSSQFDSATSFSPNTTCPGDYCGEPIVVVPSTILQNIDSGWATCSEDIRGLYDPPYALHGAAVAAVPATSPVLFSSVATPAAPASKPRMTQASPTSGSTAKPSSNGGSEDIAPGNDPSTNTPVNHDPSDGDPSDAKGSSVYDEPFDHPSDGILGNTIPSRLLSAVKSTNTFSASVVPLDSSVSRNHPLVLLAGVSSAEIDPNKKAPQRGGSDGSVALDSSVSDNNRFGAGSHGNLLSASHQDVKAIFGNANLILAAVSSIIGSDGPSNPSEHQDAENAPNKEAAASSVAIHNDKLPAAKIESSGGEDTSRYDDPAVPVVLATVGGKAVVGDPANPGGVIIGEERLTQGQTTAIAGTPISIGSDGVILSGSSTLALVESQPKGIPVITPIVTIGGKTIAADPSDPNQLISGNKMIISGTTVIFSGIPATFGPNGLVYAPSTTIASCSGQFLAEEQISGAAILTLGSRRITVIDLSGTAIVASQTLSVGGAPLVISGSTLSLGPSGIAAENAGSSEMHAFSSIISNKAKNIESSGNVVVEAPFTIDGHQYTAYGFADNRRVAVVVGDNGAHSPLTLSDGASATSIDGQMISLGLEGVQVGSGSTRKDAFWITMTATSLPSDLSFTTKSSGFTGSSPEHWEATNPAAAQTVNMSGAQTSRQVEGPLYYIMVSCVMSLLILWTL